MAFSMKIIITVAIVALAVHHAESKLDWAQFQAQCSGEIDSAKVRALDLFRSGGIPNLVDLGLATSLAKCFINKSGALDDVDDTDLSVIGHVFGLIPDHTAAKLLGILRECAVLKGSSKITATEFIDCATSSSKWV